MLDFSQAVPAEEEQADEGRLQEERHPSFAGEDRTEHITDVVRVIGPVGTELELEGEAGGNTHREVDAEQLAPELRHVLVDHPARHHVDRLHDRQDEGHAQRERHEKEVVECCHAELQARERDDFITEHGGPPRSEGER